MSSQMADPLLRDERTLTSNLQKEFRDLSRKIRAFDRDLNQIGTQSDTTIWRSDLRQRIDNVTHQCKTVRESLLELESTGANPYQIEKLKKQFTKEVDKLRECVKSIEVKERQYKPRSQSSMANETETPFAQQNRGGAYGQSNDINNPLAQSQQQQQQQQQQDFQVHVDVDELEKREEKVYGLLDQLTELNEIYGDLNELVNDQDEHIQVLSNNVEQAKEDVSAGVEHLDQAAKHQKNYRKKMCYILIIVLIIAAVITVIYFATNNNK